MVKMQLQSWKNFLVSPITKSTIVLVHIYEMWYPVFNTTEFYYTQWQTEVVKWLTMVKLRLKGKVDTVTGCYKIISLAVQGNMIYMSIIMKSLLIPCILVLHWCILQRLEVRSMSLLRCQLHSLGLQQSAVSHLHQSHLYHVVSPSLQPTMSVILSVTKNITTIISDLISQQCNSSYH